jgi:2-phospho-L-lactate guanylyltransferase
MIRDDRVVAVVPAKSFARAKSRLAGCLEPTTRAALARSMLEHVLGILEQTPAISDVLVATDGDEVGTLASARGARVIFDANSHTSLGAIIDRALGVARDRGAGAALVVMADLPELVAHDVEALVELAERADVVGAPDLRGESTNALLLRLPAPLPSRFGDPQSFFKHGDDAKVLGLRFESYQSLTLGFDLDEPDDLAAWRRGLA